MHDGTSPAAPAREITALEERKKGRKSTNYPKTTHNYKKYKDTENIQHKDAKNHTVEKHKTKTLKHTRTYACARACMHTHILKQRLKIT